MSNVEHSPQKYNFDSFPDRTKFYSLKHLDMKAVLKKSRLDITLPTDILPLWVADMDFVAPVELQDAYREMVEHGIFGYTQIPQSCALLARDWMHKVHNWRIAEEAITFSGGVIYTVIATLLACTEPGDEVLVCDPIYGPLSEIVGLHNRNLIICPLEIEDNKLTINFDTFEAAITSRTKMFIFCNPHNPGSRLWSKKELEKIAEICLTHKLLICSDDIHADIVFSQQDVHRTASQDQGTHRTNFTNISVQNYTPIATISPEVDMATITCLSPSKTFNLGGQKIAYAVINNKSLFDKIDHMHYSIWGGLPFTNFGIISFETVYREGYAWYKEALAYLDSNRQLATEYINTNISKIRALKCEATFLMWLDCRGISSDGDVLSKFFVEEARVFLSQGDFFGTGGAGFMRLNFACPRQVLQEGLERMAHAIC